MKGDFDQTPDINILAEKKQKTAAQIILRWNLQRNVVALPKTVHESRMKTNFDILGFSLDNEQMKTISEIDDGYRIGYTPERIYKHGFDSGEKRT
jgi:2,5-diketo-D-gluconate reductase A